MDHLLHLDNTFGVVLLSVVIASVLYGVSCAQVFYYFQHYSKKDGRRIKAVVIATLISDTVHQALICHTVYTYLITYYSQPLMLATLVRSPIVAVLFSGITALLVQTFYAVRIWKFSGKNVVVTATLSIFIVTEFVAVVIYVARAINMTMLVELATLNPISITMDALAAAADVLITVVFCTLLHRGRGDVERSNTMISLLISFSIQTGMLTSLCGIAALVAIIALPGTFVYVFFYFLVCRLYCNSLLATLNIRNTIRERGHDSLGISLHFVDGSNLSTTHNHKVDGDSTSKWKSWGPKPADISQVPNPTVATVAPKSFNLPLAPTTPGRVRLSPSSSRDDCSV